VGEVSFRSLINTDRVPIEQGDTEISITEIANLVLVVGNGIWQKKIEIFNTGYHK